MRDLIILGTGIHATEMAEIVGRINLAEPAWKLLGHITAKADSEDSEFFGNPILGGPEALAGFPDACIVSDNEFPKDVPIPGERLVSIIDPSCYVHPSSEIGEGSVLYPGCFVGARARIGKRVFALTGCVINHDGTVGDVCTLATGVHLAGLVTIGNGCYLGQSCSIRQSLSVGEGSLVGMGAVVVKDVPPNSVMAGNPAKPIRGTQEPRG